LRIASWKFMLLGELVKQRQKCVWKG